MSPTPGDRRPPGGDRPFAALLVAVDDEPFSGATLDVARQLADRDAARVEVICVFEPSIPVPPQRPGGVEHRCERHDRRAAATLRARVKQLTRERGHSRWPVQLRVGHAPWAISDLAAATGADLIIIGHRGKHVDEARELTRHTAHQIALAGDVPVLCVPPEQHALPASGVALDDGSQAAGRAVDVARRLVGDAGRLEVLSESPSRAILTREAIAGAQLIAVPVPGDSFDVRALMSGGAADLLDHATSAVLLVPAAPAKELSEAR